MSVVTEAFFADRNVTLARGSCVRDDSEPWRVLLTAQRSEVKVIYQSVVFPSQLGHMTEMCTEVHQQIGILLVCSLNSHKFIVFDSTMIILTRTHSVTLTFSVANALHLTPCNTYTYPSHNGTLQPLTSMLGSRP